MDPLADPPVRLQPWCQSIFGQDTEDQSVVNPSVFVDVRVKVLRHKKALV